ncbi:uncharacterized protein [Brachyistius frenatus]|uniref:uncharacterized protein isoform X1 n=1 Tax=Brachyistius frenatus TaxID=100188 RepID=UPI0037E95176
MASRRLSFHTQLSSVMEAMARSALGQVCKLVDEDSAELRLELSRLLFANSALAEKVNSLECEMTVVHSGDPELVKSRRSVGVQTDHHKDGDADGTLDSESISDNMEQDLHRLCIHCVSRLLLCVTSVSGPPTIEGIFGKDWCMNLWKDRDPYSLQSNTDSPQSLDKSVGILSDQITATEIKEEDYAEDAASSCQQETLSTRECEESPTEEPEELSFGCSVGGSTCSLSFDEDGEQIASAGGVEESSVQLVSINDTEEAFISHTIPIEEDDDDDDDDVQFIRESQLELADEPSRDNQQTLLGDDSESVTAVDKDSPDDFDAPSVKTARHPNRDKFTCQICSRSFFHKGTLTHHMKSHRLTFCNICKQHFPRKTKLNSHSCVPPSPSQTVTKSCELCGKTFANPSALRIHYVVHTGEKPHRCSLCGKRFTQKGNLKCHLRIHTGERPFRCSKCGKTFTQKVNLNHHLMAHINREFVGETPISKSQLTPRSFQKVDV